MIRFLLLLSLLASAGTPARACGYSFIGDCSTNISLRINNTPDSFYVADCPFGLDFQGLDLGEIESLHLRRASAATWESCTNHVASAALMYRIYPRNGSPSAWSALTLGLDSVTLTPPYTTRWRSSSPGTDLTAGLTPGVDYLLEIYFQAAVDTLGDDFLPETHIIQDNGGQYFHISFRYGGPSAPPFTVVTTRVEPAGCPGDSTGAAGVSVYGDLSGLFYHWSYQTTNFPALTGLPAGQYAVTVSNASGYQQSDTITIGQPPPLDANFIVLQPVGCNGEPGQLAVTGSGGTGSITYQWPNGSADPVATIPSAGLWPVTLTDSRGCQAVFAAAVPQGPPVTRSETAELCPGQTYSLGGSVFAAGGSYTVLLPGQAGACDTVVELQLSVLPDPALAVEILPVSLTLTCAAPQADLCAGSAPGFLYAWQLDGLPHGTGACVTAVTAGLFTLTVTSTGAAATCSALDTIIVDAFFDSPVLGAAVVAASGPTQPDGQIVVTATGGLAPYIFTWDEFVAGDSVGGLLPGTYCLTVTDARGCSRDSCLTVSFTAGVNALNAGDALRLYPNPAAAGGQVHLEWPAEGETPHGIELIGVDGRAWGRWDWPVGARRAALALPATLPSGPIFLRVLSGNRLIVRKLGIGSPEP